MSDIIGNSHYDWWTPVMHPSGTSTVNWHISDDITQEKLASIIRNVEDLFT
ncbi:MAG: hypothetical protein WC362_05450 [Methanoregula sp.]|jgi:predicted RNA binding protein YcfA (HicA-like mRNA interferase family)